MWGFDPLTTLSGTRIEAGRALVLTGAGIRILTKPGRRRIRASSSVVASCRTAKRVRVYSKVANSFGRPQISRPPLSDCWSST